MWLVGFRVPFPAVIRPLALLALALLALVLTADAARAQSASDLVGAWQRGWREAVAGVEAVEMRETVTREIAGPRGSVRVETVARLRYAAGGRPVRTVEQATVDGRAVDPDRLPGLDRRHERALGPGPGPLFRPPSSPGAFFAASRLRGLRRETVDGVPLWRVDVEVPPSEGRPAGRRGRRGGPSGDRPFPPSVGAAWFAGDAAQPRLVRLDVPAGPDGSFRVDFQRIGGLDLPAAAEGSARLRQQRRLRGYEVTATVRALYADHRIVRR